MGQGIGDNNDGSQAPVFASAAGDHAFDDFQLVGRVGFEPDKLFSVVQCAKICALLLVSSDFRAGCV